MSAKPKTAAAIKQSKDPDQWINALEAITINEQDWNCMIIMIVETLPEHKAYIEFFDEAAEEGSRKAIYSLTYGKVINSIKTLSKVDQDKCPVAQGVFHHANKLISRGELLDASLVAKLVKYLVYRAKIDAIMRSKRESNYENEVDQEIRAMLNVGKVESQRSIKSGKTKKSAESVESKPPEKVNTHVRKSGEEWKDKVYIDDAPRGGPDLYIILTGFRNPALPLELLRARIPLNCIIKIKRPGDTFDIAKNSWSNVDNNHDESQNVSKNGFDQSDVTTQLLHDFWCALNKSCNDPENLDDFSSIIFRTFCPPVLPGNNNQQEAEEFKKDLYDRISCIVYDLYDLQRLHADYIRSMKLEKVPKEFSKDRDISVYKRIMDSVPAECCFVAVILQAMLAQVEADFKDDESEHPTEIEQDSLGKRKIQVNSFISNRSTTDQLDYHRKRLQELNFQYGITKSKNEQPEVRKKDPEIILEDDELRLKTYHVRLDDDVAKLIDPRPNSLSDLAMRSLQDPRIIDLWKFRRDTTKETVEKNRHRINKLAGCFQDFVDHRSVVHYLHLQVFDKIIQGHLNGVATRSEDRRISIIGKGCPPSATLSYPSLLSSKTVQGRPTFAAGENPISHLRGFESDSIIDYGKNDRDVLECSELFALTDTREMLQPGFLERWKEKLCETETAGTSVAEFTNVRILSANVFLQLISDCLCKFQDFHSRYFELTDTVLLCFGKERGTSDSCDSRVTKIVTPVCLRNFCEYVIIEEDAWVRDTEKERTGSLTTDVGELTRKLSHHSDIDTVKAATFTDDDFILPNSLKGQARRGHQERSLDPTESLEKMSTKSKKPGGKSEKDIKDAKGRKMKSALRSSGEKSSKDAKTVDIESSSLPARKVSSLRCARHGDPYKFVGYDLGNRRVQLTTRCETFTSADGTLVRVDSDEWLYRKKLLGIGIHLAGCYLKVEHMIDDPNHDQLFHLITKNGIVVAFTKRLEDDSASGPNQNSVSRFDFRASWPSGLSVEPVRDDSSKNSFYILQRYISKGPECEPVSRENYRKFLRNGTVLKFLDDDAVEVMRPNGTIVRCLEFEKLPATGDSELERIGELTKDDIRRRKKSRSLMSTRGQRNASSPRKPSRRNSQDDQNKGTSIAKTPLDSNMVVRCVIKDYGTRITTGFVIEDEPLISDWSDDEFDKFFGNVPGRHSRLTSEAPSSHSNDGTRSGSYRSAARRSAFPTDRLRKLLDDAFVSVLMTCRMEHECYATVAYGPADQSCKLSMPDELVIGISQEGLCDIDVGRNIELRIRDDNLTYLSKIHENGQPGVSTSTYYFRHRDSHEEHKRILLETVDSLRNVFRVYEDGSVIREEDTEVTGKISTNSRREEYRLFAMNRDLTGFEYLEKSKRDEYQAKMNSDERSSAISISIPDGSPGLEYRLFLNPLEPTNYSKMWLQKPLEFKRTNHDGTDLSRSTYSTPYDWLFPFGRNGNGVRKNTWKVPIAEPIQEGHPGVLTLSVFQEIARPGKNVLIELQKALGCYWPMMMKESGEDCKSSPKNEKCDKQNWVLDLALGVSSNIPANTYLSGISTNRPKVSDSETRGVPKPARPGQEDTVENKELRWYKKCIRERIILPYFKNIQGSCFLWIASCVDVALELVDK